MPGLLNNTEQQPVAPEAGYQGEPNVSPQEQAQYDAFMDNATQLLEKTFPQVMDRIKDSPEPAEALAAAVATTVMRLEDSAKESGNPMSPDVLLQGGVEILENLADLTAKAGVHEFTDDEVESATYQALDLYREMGTKDGRIDQEAVQMDMQALAKADEAGALGSLYPELNGKFGKGKA